MRVLDETEATISEWEKDETNPRYGKPTYYNVELTMHHVAGIAKEGATVETRRVHWTRILHVVDNLEGSEVYGAPRMRPVYNRLYDLHKLYGGSAEMYWKGAFFGLSLETHPQLGADVDYDEAAMKRTVENWENSLSRVLFMPGIGAKTLAPAISDPSPQIERQLEAICILLGVPKRVFMGSERGELSSNQDIRAWYGKVKRRQDRYITPRIIVPFIDRLIQADVLPEPEQYFVTWEDVASVTELEKADIAVKHTDAITKYVGGSGEALMEPRDFLVRVLGYTTDEAEEIIDAKVAAIEAGEIKDPMAEPEVPTDEFGNPIMPPGMSPEEGEEGGEMPFGKEEGDEKGKPPFGKKPMEQGGEEDEAEEGDEESDEDSEGG